MAHTHKRVVVSQSRNIFENLALENYLFEHLSEEEELLFLWKNSDAVVIGRFQDPEIECNLRALERDRIPLARRQSGGGTVWHDLGNLCFTFMGPKTGFDRKKNLILVQTALQKLGIPALLNDRHDILLQGKKISGSAFREKADRAFHHGTLLVTSELEKLSFYLKPEKEKPRSRHIRSIPSPVTRIADWLPELSVTDIEQGLSSTYCPDSEETISAEQLERDGQFRNNLQHLTSRDWILGSGSS